MTENINILIVEDSQDDCDILVRHFKKANVPVNYKRVETETDLVRALEQQEWQTVICDFTLPQLTAPAVLAIVKKQWPDIPFIVLSGSVGEERAVEAMRAGANDYIMKDNLTRLVPIIQREVKEAARRIERRQMALALQKSEENLRQSQKLESIGQLAGGIAHDFNNLMATISIQSEVLLKSLDKKLTVEEIAERVQKGVEQIKKSSERATSLTRQLLAFSRKQIILPQLFNMNSSISEMQDMLLRVVESNITFHLRLDDNLKNVKMDPGHLEQIIINLVMNSRDALPKGGNIYLETKNCELDGLAAKSNNAPHGSYVCFSVSDDGMGMPEEVRKNAFEPFFTTKPLGKGTGLGLSTVYGIVQQNKGFITVESEPGKGSVFTVLIPASAEISPAKNTTSVVDLAQGGSEKILVVEDEDDLRVLLEETLSEFGYKVLTARNGAEALTVLTPDTDIIITDVMMPLMGGAELAAHALKINPRLKVIFQSGYTKNSVIQDGLPQKQMFFLAKPYKISALLAEIKKILAKH